MRYGGPHERGTNHGPESRGPPAVQQADRARGPDSPGPALCSSRLFPFLPPPVWGIPSGATVGTPTGGLADSVGLVSILPPLCLPRSGIVVVSAGDPAPDGEVAPVGGGVVCSCSPGLPLCLPRSGIVVVSPGEAAPVGAVPAAGDPAGPCSPGLFRVLPFPRSKGVVAVAGDAGAIGLAPETGEVPAVV